MRQRNRRYDEPGSVPEIQFLVIIDSIDAEWQKRVGAYTDTKLFWSMIVLYTSTNKESGPIEHDTEAVKQTYLAQRGTQTSA